MRTSGEIAARFHVSTLNASGKMSSIGIGSEEIAPLRASMLPMQLVQFALIMVEEELPSRFHVVAAFGVV